MKNKEPIIVTITVKAGKEKIWEAITNPRQMKLWFFDIPEFEAKPGAAFSFEGGAEERVYRHLCTVVEVLPFQKLSYTWKYEGYEGESLVSFEILAADEMTKLVLTHIGLESFPADKPDFKKENFKKGWKHIIGTVLKNFVESNNNS